MEESIILTEQQIPLDVAGDLLSVNQANNNYVKYSELECSGLEYCSGTKTIIVNDIIPDNPDSSLANNSYYIHVNCSCIHVAKELKSKLEMISQYLTTTDDSIQIGPWTLNMTDDGLGQGTYNVSASYCEDLV